MSETNDYYYQVNDQLIRRDIIDNYYEPVQTPEGIQLVRTDLIEQQNPQLGIGPLVIPLIGAATTLFGTVASGIQGKKQRAAQQQAMATQQQIEADKQAAQRKLLLLGLGGAGLLLTTIFILKKRK